MRNSATSNWKFPNPELATPEGLLCAGGEWETSLLLAAYRQGIFPWPQEGLPILWFCPNPRGVLLFKNLHWPRSFIRFLAKTPFEIRFNSAFKETMHACAEAKRKEQTETWILPEMIEAYCELHRLGFAHSIEAWYQGELAGGVYGLLVDGIFSGESMFHRRSDAGKQCLFALVERLQALHIEWMDIQMVTPILKTLGGTYLPRKKYLELLKKSQRPNQVLVFP